MQSIPTMKTILTNKEKVAHYEFQSAKWLAAGNAAKERGNYQRAEVCYAKAERALSLANRRIEDGK